MTITTHGDLAQHVMLLRHTSVLQGAIKDRLDELGSSEVADITRHLSGDYTLIAGIERSLTLTESHLSVVDSARTIITGQGLAFDRARSYLNDLGMDLIDAAESVDQTRRAAALADSRTAFEDVVAALNTQSGGRSLFAGASAQSAAFADADDILASFAASVAGATTHDQVLTIADTWFAPGGGYDTDAYTGSATPLGAFRIGEQTTISADLSGNDTEIRELLKYHAIMAVVADGGTSLIDAEQSNLMADVGGAMINLDRDLIGTRASIGSTENRLDKLESSLSAENYALMASRKKVVGVDTAETVLALSELETQLQGIYTITARVSRLKLTEFL